MEALTESGVNKDEAIFQALRNCIKASKSVRFEGDGYSEEWKKEAAQKGLTNITNVPDAISAYESKEAKELFTSQHILSEREIFSRTEVMHESYTLKIQIEARVLGDLAINHIVPIAVKYQNRLMENIKLLKSVTSCDKEFNDLAGNRMDLIKNISHHITNIKSGVFEMIEERKKANKIEGSFDKAKMYSENVFPYLDEIRYHIDKLELIVDDEIWPLPKYRELLFIH